MDKMKVDLKSGRGDCLLCSNQIVKAKASSSPAKNNGNIAISFQSLMRYLHIDVSKVIHLSSTHPDHPQHCPNETKTSTPPPELLLEAEEALSTALCEDCISLANLFGGIYKDFETARLLLQGVIEMLVEQIKKSLHLEEIRREGVGGDPTKVDELKAEILKQCDLKLKSKTPVDLLTRALETTEEESNHNEEIPSDVPNDDGVIVIGENGRNSGDEEEVEEVVSSGNSCKFCEFTSSDNSQTTLQLHVVQLHPMETFPQLNLTSKGELAGVIEEILDKGHISKEGYPEGSFQCYFCNNGINGPQQGPSRTLHLTEAHMDKVISVMRLQRKRKSLEKEQVQHHPRDDKVEEDDDKIRENEGTEQGTDPANSGTKSIPPNTKPKPKRKFLKCKICREKFLSSEYLRKHETSHHQRKTEDGRLSCAYCPFISDRKNIFEIHQLTSHPLQIFKGDLPPQTTEEDLQSAVESVMTNEAKLRLVEGQRFNCDLCGSVCHVRNKKAHVLTKHYENVLKVAQSLLLQK